MFHRAVLWSRTKTCCYREMQSSEITSYHIALKAFLWCYIPLCTLKRWKLLCENEKKQKQQILWLKCSDADNSVINLCGFYHSTWLVFTWRPQSDVIMHVYETTTFSWMLWYHITYHQQQGESCPLWYLHGLTLNENASDRWSPILSLSLLLTSTNVVTFLIGHWIETPLRWKYQLRFCV